MITHILVSNFGIEELEHALAVEDEKEGCEDDDNDDKDDDGRQLLLLLHVSQQKDEAVGLLHLTRDHLPG